MSPEALSKATGLPANGFRPCTKISRACGAGILATAREKGKGLEMTRCEILGPSVGRQERIVEEKLSVLSGDS